MAAFLRAIDRIVSTTDFGQSFIDEASWLSSYPFEQSSEPGRWPNESHAPACTGCAFSPTGTDCTCSVGSIPSVCRPGTARRSYAVTRGSRPVSLATGADGFTVFGDYWANEVLEPVRIHGSRDGGATWNVVYAFSAGEVRHVHGISYDPYDTCFWICAGDDGDQCRLLRASADFRNVEIVRKGGQENRFYSLLVAKHQIITATDTPFEDNSICAIDKRTGQLRRIARIENLSFYSCFVGSRFFVSTNAEPSSVNDVREVHLWMGTMEGDAPTSARRVLSLPIDLYSHVQRCPGIPSGLFQYPRIFFPEGENPSDMLVGHAIGVGRWDGSMIVWNVAALGDEA